ncbi:MAG: TonB family protein [Gemmatimonadaceae bacterium]
MLTTLLESRRRLTQRRSAVVASAAGHGALILVLVVGRASGGHAAADEPLRVNITYIDPERAALEPPRVPQPGVPAPVLIDVQPTLPDISLPSQRFVAILPSEFQGGPHATFDRLSIADAAGSQRQRALIGDVLTERSVDMPVAMIAGQSPPQYPVLLQRAGVAGHVAVQFIVDTLGRVETGSVTVLGATHPDFVRAVAVRLATLRFTPARAGGALVRQLVEQRFEFVIR